MEDARYPGQRRVVFAPATGSGSTSSTTATTPALLDIPDERLVVRVGEVPLAGAPRHEHGDQPEYDGAGNGANGDPDYLPGPQNGR